MLVDSTVKNSRYFVSREAYAVARKMGPEQRREVLRKIDERLALANLCGEGFDRGRLRKLRRVLRK